MLMTENKNIELWDKLYQQQLSSLKHSSMNLIVAWHVLYYLKKNKLIEMLALFRRLLKPGGRLIATGIGEKDLYSQQSIQLSNGSYRLSCSEQTDAEILLFNKDDYEDLYEGFDVKVGDVSYQMEDRTNHYHMILATLK